MCFYCRACLYRSTHWWDDVVLKTFTEEDWVENFRVSKHTFHYLCEQLSPLIKRKDTVLRKAIPVEHRLAITLWCLATCGEYRTIEQPPSAGTTAITSNAATIIRNSLVQYYS